MKQIIFTFILSLIFCSLAFAQLENSFCAKIEVTGGGQVEPGTAMLFTVNITGKTNYPNIEYDWKVSAGTIADGQGTPSIMVDTTNIVSGTNITAEVKIKGLVENCTHTASEIGGVISLKPICGGRPDEFGKLSNNEVKARIQNLFIGIENNPNSQGYIINYGTDEEIVARERQIQKAIRFFKLDANLVTVVRGGENPNRGVWTKIWIVPPGAEFPQP